MHPINFHTHTNNAVLPVVDGQQPLVEHYHTKHVPTKLPNLMPVLRNNSGDRSGLSGYPQNQQTLPTEMVSMKDLMF